MKKKHKLITLVHEHRMLILVQQRPEETYAARRASSALFPDFDRQRAGLKSHRLKNAILNTKNMLIKLIKVLKGKYKLIILIHEHC